MLNQAQLTTLAAAIAAETDPTFVANRNAGATGAMAEWFNGASTFIVWRPDVTAEEIGNAWSGTDIDGMTAINMQRLQLLLASAPSGVFDMTRGDRRTGFEGPFGTNQNNASRVAMNAVWKRAATRGERLFATGTGTTANPGIASVTGPITNDDIVRALEA
jgi:hypothetical protein